MLRYKCGDRKCIIEEFQQLKKDRAQSRFAGVLFDVHHKRLDGVI